MDKCLPVIDLFSNGQRDSALVSEEVTSPIIWEDMSVYYLRQLASSLQDHDLQQKIDHEIKMREGTAKLLAASKHPAQMLEAAKNLLTSNTRIMTYMSELQRRKTAEVLGKNTSTIGNQLPCKAKVSISDIRIPLMWKDTDHFKNKGDYRRYAVFCLLKIGTDIFETSMLSNVDRSMTDLTFDDIMVFNNVPHDFTCRFEVYCHKLHEDLTIASTPKKLRKKINDLSGSVGRSVGKRLSGLNDSDIIGNMVLGPRFELMASGTLELKDIGDSIGNFDLQLTSGADVTTCELPLFGVFCLRLACQPECLVEPVVSGYLNLVEEEKVKPYWCVLKNLALSCWSSKDDMEVTEPLLEIPVTKNTQISDSDPSKSLETEHTFHIMTKLSGNSLEYTLAAGSKDELGMWWDGLQQHLLDQALWKHACDFLMEIRSPSPRKKPAFLRKSSIYDDTPLAGKATSRPSSVVGELQKEDDQLSQMLNTLMGEAKQIRGDKPYTTTV
ncbi:rhotekin-like isoform X2 [Ostrea edulis]|uniref:rhotekin-like isoform X2 n=1 Tax=Ostrea edulis TaxID=37623 RepID=UPI002096379A|nr:rhotekin-like isoform X2 [Ostrea edulis]